MGIHWRDILTNSDDLQSKHVLAWTWVVSPAPDLMALVPENQRRDFVCDLTEKVVEDYYIGRGFTTNEWIGNIVSSKVKQSHRCYWNVGLL